MNTPTLTLQRDPAAYAPGETIQGLASWSLATPPETVFIRLFWFTDGKGGRDVEIADEIRFDLPPAAYETDFTFTAPYEPWSYDGKLLSIQWAIELICDNTSDTTRQDIVIAPDHTPVTPS